MDCHCLHIYHLFFQPPWMLMEVLHFTSLPDVIVLQIILNPQHKKGTLKWLEISYGLLSVLLN